MNEAAPSGGPSGWANRTLQAPAAAGVAGRGLVASASELSARPWPSAPVAGGAATRRHRASRASVPASSAVSAPSTSSRSTRDAADEAAQGRGEKDPDGGAAQLRGRQPGGRDQPEHDLRGDVVEMGQHQQGQGAPGQRQGQGAGGGDDEDRRRQQQPQHRRDRTQTARARGARTSAPVAAIAARAR